jgi:hypothetical protein
MNQIRTTRDVNGRPRWAGVALLAMALLSAAVDARTASAEVVGGMRYGIVTIHNETPYVIRYSYRIGDGNWHQVTLEPKHCRYYWHEYAYANENRSPNFHIRFDSDMTSGVATRRLTLSRNRAPYVKSEFGRHYDFKTMSDGQINLYAR